MIILVEISEKFTLNYIFSIISLTICVIVFEGLENLVFLNLLTGVYPNYPEIIKDPIYAIDTFTDMIFGLIGGITYLYWYDKHGTNSR